VAAGLLLVGLVYLAAGGAPWGVPGSGLDAPFLAPPAEAAEGFPVEFDTAMMRLPEEEQAQLLAAVGFLMFCSVAELEEQDPQALESANELDLLNTGFNGLYLYAAERGDAMTLRRYIELSDELKTRKPEWWTAFQQAGGQPLIP